MPRELVVTADDLGLTPAANAAVAELAGASALTAASLVTTGPVAEEALGLYDPLTLGVHIMLPDAGDLDDAAIEAAMEAQVAWLLDRGRAPAHLDLHTVGLYGFGPHAARPQGVVPQAISVAARHRLALRLPRHPRVPGLSRARLDVHREHVRRADRLGVPLPEVVLADMRPAHQVLDYPDLRDHVLGRLTALPLGRSELVLHPEQHPSPRQDKARFETELLRSGALEQACAAAGIALTHW